MELLTGVVMEIISYGTQPVIFQLVVMSVQFEMVPALEMGIVLKLTRSLNSDLTSRDHHERRLSNVYDAGILL